MCWVHSSALVPRNHQLVAVGVDSTLEAITSLPAIDQRFLDEPHTRINYFRRSKNLQLVTFERGEKILRTLVVEIIMTPVPVMGSMDNQSQ